MLSYWVSFLAYPNLFGIKGFVVVVIVRLTNKPILKFLIDRMYVHIALQNIVMLFTS
jgi:hypothetical protein